MIVEIVGYEFIVNENQKTKIDRQIDEHTEIAKEMLVR